MVESTVESVSKAVVDLTGKELIRVLHVDDEAGFLKSAKQCLEMQGAFEVETASSVEEATGILEKKSFDVIVSDYQMPEKNGLEFLKELRDRGQDIPFIIFTGKGREEVAVKALNLGANQYLNKVGYPETVYGELAHGLCQAVERKRAEKLLRESEEKYRNLFENARDVTLTLDLKGNVTSINKAAVEYGFKKEEIIGKNMLKFVRKKYWPKLLKELVQLARGKIVEGNIEIITPKGDKIVEYWSNPIIVDSKVTHVQIVLKDITERKQTEEELTRLSSAVKMSTDSIVISDLDGKIVDVNEATLKMYGTDDKNDLVGKSSFDLIAPEDREIALAGTKETMRRGYVRGREYNVVTKDGGRIPVEMSAAIMKGADGKPIGFVGISRDIRERKKAENERNKLLLNLGERIKELRCLYDISKLVEKPKITLDEILQGIINLLPRAWRYPDVACARIVSEEREFKTENFKETRWKQQADIEVNGKRVGSVEIGYLEKKPKLDKGPFFKEEHALIDAVAERLGRIIERKKMEESLRRSEEKYRNIVELAPDSIITANTKGVVTSVNSVFTRLSGFSKDEVVGKHFTKVGTLRKRDLPMYLKTFASVLRGKVPKPFEVIWKHKDGTTHPTEIHITLMKEHGKIIGFQAITRDTTERKHAEERLRSSEERLKMLFEFAPDAYYLNDLTGNFVDGNKAAEELTGYNRSELVGKTFLKLGLLGRRQIPKAAKLLAKNALGKPTGPDEFVLNRKDGAQVSVEIRTFPVKIKGRTLVLGIARDVTERKRTLEKFKILNEKLEVVGKLTRHDVRNKLSAVTNNVYLAKQTLADNHEALKCLGDVESAVRQTERIFEFARTYEKLGVEELAYVNVEKTLKEATMLFSDLHGVKVVNDCHGLTVLADSLLRQIFYNLIHNSLKHGEKTSRIEAYYEEAGKNKLKLVYEDDGVGIPKAEKEKIFMEGYGKGTGYGLYLIRKMCEVYGWAIRETGKYGKGAQFTITIPKMNEIGKMAYRLP